MERRNLRRIPQFLVKSGMSGQTLCLGRLDVLLRSICELGSLQPVVSGVVPSGSGLGTYVGQRFPVIIPSIRHGTFLIHLGPRVLTDLGRV